MIRPIPVSKFSPPVRTVRPAVAELPRIPETPLTFAQWLDRQRHRDGLVGRLARGGEFSGPEQAYAAHKRAGREYIEYERRTKEREIAK